ncbi:MAG: sterol desaturase family protein [Myxococcota bacterium]
MELISYFVPVFLLCIVVEWWWSHRNEKGFYRLVDTLADLSTGILNQVMTVLFGAVAIGLYVLLYDVGHIWTFETIPWWLWGIGLLAADLSYYWFHRVSHERNFMWLMHVPHHQSEEYNYSVALRQGIAEFLGSMWFHLPWALVGLPPIWYFQCVAINTIFQFFVHTRGIDKMGPIEGIINTPATHRVHHACDPHYLDKNYAGMFTFYDRLFGTYVPETTPPTFGTVMPLASWNPLWANGELIHKINVQSKGKGLWAWVRLWLSSPADLVDGPFPEVSGRDKYDARPQHNRYGYIFFLFVNASVGLNVMLFAPEVFSALQMWLIGAFVLWSTLNIGAYSEQKPWSSKSEGGRMLYGVALVSVLMLTV